MVAGPYIASELVTSTATSTSTTSTWSGVLGLVSVLTVLLAILMVLGSRTHRSLSGWLTGAVFIDSRDPYAGGPDNQPPLALTEAKKVELGLPI